MKIAIIGATGLVGQNIIKILNEKNLLHTNEIVLYASSKHDKTVVDLYGKLYTIHELRNDTIEDNIDFALFSAGSSISLKWAKEFIEKGAYVIDNSSAFRRDNNVPLVVPEINASDIQQNTKLIANPNCSTIGLVLPLHAISKISKIKRVIATTFQAVSGAGNSGIDDYMNNYTKKLFWPIKDNLLPHIDSFLDNGYTFEEDKMQFETRKILHDENINISATCVRVPIKNCHSESLTIELHETTQINEICELLRSQKGISLYDNPQTNTYPMPLIANNKDNIFVGRLRKDTSSPASYNMFICFDNIRKGAALNAIQIMEWIINNNYIN